MGGERPSPSPYWVRIIVKFRGDISPSIEGRGVATGNYRRSSRVVVVAVAAK
jgi:hypothetical protein